MHIGFCRIELFLPDSQNLKAKRQIARSVIARIHNQFNVTVAEADDNDLWQRLTLGVCCLSNDTKHANEILSNVVAYVEKSRDDLELLDHETEIIAGL
ncbi:MAG: DUF503 domain-containing protein [Chloroflexota bacterium]|nr:DUF503 domain-containing protein [Chloroflexota bacterium]MEC9287432.1 DUF503 domain-containing protein [Chloroflexota bacterium]